MEAANQQAQKQLQLQKQFAMKKQQMERAKLQAKQQGKLPVNAESLDAKISSLVSEKISSFSEAGDWWHPDPEKDKKLPGRGPKLRAREDAATATKSKPDYSKSLKPGESYMDFAKRKARGESYVPGQPAEKLGAVTAIPQSEREAAKQRLLAKAKAKREAMQKEETDLEEGMTMKDFKKNRSRQKQKEKRAAEKTSPLRRAGIHDDKASPERAARHRANVDPDFEGNDERNYPGGKLKSFKKMRKAKATGELTTEGKVAWDDKKNPNPSGYTPKEKSEAKRKQLGVDNPDTQSFEKGGPGEKEYARHGNLSAAQEKMKKRGEQPKGKPHQFKKDPFWKKTKGQVKRTMFGTDVPKSKESSYPSSVAKAKSRNEETEMLTFSQFMEARRMDKEGVDRGDSRRSERAERAKASLAAVKKGAERQQKMAKKYGTPVTGDTVEKRAHKRDFPGSRQEPKKKGEKETALQTHNRRVNRQVSRVVKHGHTAKEKEASRGMYSSRFD
jgi:hypothetical protein